jgi:hypothetical protein
MCSHAGTECPGISNMEWLVQKVYTYADQPGATVTPVNDTFSYFDHDFQMMLKHMDGILAIERDLGSSHYSVESRSSTTVESNGDHTLKLEIDPRYSEKYNPGSFLFKPNVLKKWASTTSKIRLTYDDAAYRATRDLLDAHADAVNAKAQCVMHETASGAAAAAAAGKGDGVPRQVGLIGTIFKFLARGHSATGTIAYKIQNNDPSYVDLYDYSANVIADYPDRPTAAAGCLGLVGAGLIPNMYYRPDEAMLDFGEELVNTGWLIGHLGGIAAGAVNALKSKFNIDAATQITDLSNGYKLSVPSANTGVCLQLLNADPIGNVCVDTASLPQPSYIVIGGFNDLSSSLIKNLKDQVEDATGYFAVTQSKGLKNLIIADLSSSVSNSENNSSLMWVEVWNSQKEFATSGWQESYWKQYLNDNSNNGTEAVYNVSDISNALEGLDVSVDLSNWAPAAVFNSAFKALWDHAAEIIDPVYIENSITLAPQGVAGVCSYQTQLISSVEKPEANDPTCVICNNDGCRLITTKVEYDASDSVKKNDGSPTPTGIVNPYILSGVISKVL